MEEGFQFRDVFNSHTVKKIALGISKAYPQFPREKFCREINKTLTELAFLDRAKLISENLKKHLPDSFPKAAEILVQSLGPEPWPKEEELKGWEGFYIMPLCLFISQNGLGHPKESLKALYEMTKRFTAEGDIRPFLIKHQKTTLEFLAKLTQDKSPFARRLASEGTRPRLPLAPRLPEFQKDPTPVFKLLESLKNDSNLMVRRSVANNLNDISKDHPKKVVALLKEWQKEKSKEMDWLIKHSLRGLLKKGEPSALELLGYSPNAKLELVQFRLSKRKIKIGGQLPITLSIKNMDGKKANVMLDYAIHYMKANGKLSPKVFKGVQKKMLANEELIWNKNHSFKKIGIRPFYPGKHEVEIFANGNSLGREAFQLVPEA